jgi:hypothetical protein
MNIFWLDLDPHKSAEYACDQHITKMVTEYAQLLMTALHTMGFKNLPMKPVPPNGPIPKWVRASYGNFAYLYLLTEAYHEEYQKRFGPKEHLGWTKLKHVIDHFSFVAIALSYKQHGCKSPIVTRDSLLKHPEDYITLPPLCVPDEFKPKSCTSFKTVVHVYRKAYQQDKIRFARWNHGPVPQFMRRVVKERQESGGQKVDVKRPR